MSQHETPQRFKRPPVGDRYGFIYPITWTLLEVVSKFSLYQQLRIKSAIGADLYIFSWWIVSGTSLYWVFSGSTGTVMVGLAVGVYRYLDIMTVLLSVLVRRFIKHNPRGQERASGNRTLLLMLSNGVEIFVLFAIFYIGVQKVWPCSGEFSVGNLSVADALYYSVVTATTTGYGDIVPKGPLAKCIAILESLSMFLVFVVVFSSVASQRPGIPDLEDSIPREDDAS